jgi:hypothetical protein
MKPTITLKDSSITFGAFTPGIGGLKEIPETTIDLAPYAGQHIRIWLDDDGTYSLDKKRGHLWQMVELDVPAQEYTETASKELDPDTKEPVVTIEKKAINIEAVSIDTLDLPALAKKG